jgi:hypothetical protein
MSNTIRVSVLVSSPATDARPKNGDKKSSRLFEAAVLDERWSLV